jgi:hypothetical protein
VPYFTSDDLLALPDLSRFTEDRLTAAHDWIAAIVERECETSFIVSTTTDERLSGGGLDYLRLNQAYVRSVTAVTVDGVAYDAGQLAALFVEDGYLFAAAGATWPTTSRGNVLVSYTYGYSTTPPDDLKEAMLRGARYWLLSGDAWSPSDSRSTGISNEFGNITLSVAGEDRPTGVPNVDSTIMAWARKVRVPKVA